MFLFAADCYNSWHVTSGRSLASECYLHFSTQRKKRKAAMYLWQSSDQHRVIHSNCEESSETRKSIFSKNLSKWAKTYIFLANVHVRSWTRHRTVEVTRGYVIVVVVGRRRPLLAAGDGHQQLNAPLVDVELLHYLVRLFNGQLAEINARLLDEVRCRLIHPTERYFQHLGLVGEEAQVKLFAPVGRRCRLGDHLIRV